MIHMRTSCPESKRRDFFLLAIMFFLKDGCCLTLTVKHLVFFGLICMKRVFYLFFVLSNGFHYLSEDYKKLIKDLLNKDKRISYTMLISHNDRPCKHHHRKYNSWWELCSKFHDMHEVEEQSQIQQWHGNASSLGENQQKEQHWRQ